MNSKIYNVVILDKSGSMTSIRKQAVDSVNETFGCIRSMRKKNAEQEQFVTLVAFCGCEQKVIEPKPLANQENGALHHHQRRHRPPLLHQPRR